MSGFIIYILVSIFTPGPNNIFSSASSAKAGFFKTLPFMVGVFVGTFIVFFITGLFNVYLYENVQFINQVIGIFGGLFILYLALAMFRSRHQDDQLMIKNGKLFPMAIALTLINPKAIIFGLTVATFYLNLGYNPNGMFVLSLINAILCFLSVIVWGFFGHTMRQILQRYQLQFNIFMALLLGYSGLLIIVESI
jgi:threonine/homoserine/homoserine lactone efflux protein